MAADLSALQSAVARNGTVIAQAVTVLPDLRGKLAALSAQLENASANSIDPAQLAAIVASADAATDQLANVLAGPVTDDQTPTGPVEVPAPTNPDTPDPASVEGSVPAGEPLPAELDPNGVTQQTSPGADAIGEVASEVAASADTNADVAPESDSRTEL